MAKETKKDEKYVEGVADLREPRAMEDTDNVKLGEEINGTHCKVYIVAIDDMGSFDADTAGTVIGGQTDATLSRAKEVREIFHKDCEGGYAKKSGGKNSWSLSASGMVIFGDEGLEMLEGIMDGDGKCGAFVQIGNRKYYGECIATQNDLALPGDSEVTYDLSFEGTGPLKKVDKSMGELFRLPKNI